MKNIIEKNIKFGMCVLAMTICLWSAGKAQNQGGGSAGQSLAGVELKGKVPVNRESLKVKLPAQQEATLANGLLVVVLANHKVPTFTMQMVVLSGGLSDPPTQHGLATFTAAMLDEGTTKRGSLEISEQFETLGASFSAASGLNSLNTNITVSGLKENFATTLEVFGDVVRSPKFAVEEFEKYKTGTLSQIQYQRSIPQFLAQEKLYQMLYGDHPGAFISIIPEVLKAAQSADLAKFHSTFYRPNNALLIVTGDVSLKEIMPKIEFAFGDWQKADVPQTTIPSVRPLEKSHITIIDRPGSVQTVFLLGNLGIERTSADYFPLIVMDQIYGAGPSSRLFRNLREEKGYTYGAYSSFTASKFQGNFVSRSEVRNDATTGALKEFMYEMNRLRDEPVSTMDLENAKRALVGSFALSLEQPATLLQYIITQKRFGFPANYWDLYPQGIAAVTADDVQRVARKYVDLPHLQIVAVGDAAKIREALEKYGTVEISDQNIKK